MKKLFNSIVLLAIVITSVIWIDSLRAQTNTGRTIIECYKGIPIYYGAWDVPSSAIDGVNVGCQFGAGGVYDGRNVYFLDFTGTNINGVPKTPRRVSICWSTLEQARYHAESSLNAYSNITPTCDINKSYPITEGSGSTIDNSQNTTSSPVSNSEGVIKITAKISCASQAFSKLVLDVFCVSGSKIDCSKIDLIYYLGDNSIPISQGSTAPHTEQRFYTESTYGGGLQTKYVWDSEFYNGAEYPNKLISGQTKTFSFEVNRCTTHRVDVGYFARSDINLPPTVTILGSVILPSEVPGYNVYGYNAVCWPCESLEKITVIGDKTLLPVEPPQEPPPEYERPLVCGDGTCSASAGENNDTCPRDCVCKIDGICDRTERIIAQRYTDTIVEQKWVDGQIVSTPKVVESVSSYTVGGENEINCPQDCSIPYPMFGVITLPADPVMARSAFLNGMIMSGPEAKTYQYWFTYYPCSSPDLIANTAKASVSLAASGPNGDVSSTVSVQITNLLPNTCYNFRLIGADEKNIIQSGIEMFTTKDKDEVISCPELVLPEMGRQINTLTPLLSWTTPTSAKYFSYALYEDDPAGTLRANGLSATSSVQLTNKLSWNKHYYWLVNACSDSSQTNCSGWCQPWHFVTGQLLTAPIIKTPSSTPIYDPNPVISWYPVENAVIYEYVLLNGNGEAVETETTSTTFLLTKNILTKGNYTAKVRACADTIKENCSPFGIKSFELKDVTDDLDACNSLRIGTQKYEPNVSYPFLLKCADGICPSSYTQVNGQPYNVMQQYPVNSNYNVYLLDETENQKYESGGSNQLVIGKTYKLVIAPLAMPQSDYSDPLLSDNGTTSFAQYVNDANTDFKNNNLLGLKDYVDQEQAPFSLGIGIDDPLKKDGFTANSNEFFEKSVVNGQLYFKALTTTDSVVVPQAEISVSVPKLNSYQTIDNNYYNLGCLKPTDSVKISFFVVKDDTLVIDAEYLGEAIVHVKTDPDKENLTYKLKCGAQYKGQEVILTTKQDTTDVSKFKVILGGKTIDTDATCQAEVYDPEKDKTYQDEVVVPKDDIKDEKPLAPTKIKDPYFELCQYPGKVTITWVNDSKMQQTGYRIQIVDNANKTIFDKTNEDYLGDSVSINIVDILNASNDTLEYTGQQESYTAKVMIKAKDSSIWSDWVFSNSFNFPSCPPRLPIIQGAVYNAKKNIITFFGAENNLGGLACGATPDWRWITSDNPNDSGEANSDCNCKVISNYQPGDPIYLKLKFDGGSLGTCETVTSTKYGKNLQMQESAEDVGQ